ncbi:MAG: hypothetical protein ACYDHH_00225 [Solirubrobacteraceae bacterium]
MRRVLAIAVLPAMLLLVGCGSSSHHRRAAITKPSPSPKLVPMPAQTFGTADPAAVVVVKAWANALRSGDITGAARYFALPSAFANGIAANGQIPVVRIRSYSEALAINRSLPCGAQFVSARQHGPYVVVLFRLTSRTGPGGSNCGSGAGQLASTFFLIRGGKIVDWIRGPTQQLPGTGTGGSGTGTGSVPTPAPAPAPAPSTNPGGGVPVA